MKIGITNTVLSNTGDAAICLSIIDILRAEHPDADLDFVIFDADARATRALYPDLEVRQQLAVLRPFRPGKLWKIVNKMRMAAVAGLASESVGRRLIGLAGSVLFGRAFRDAADAVREVDLIISSGGTYLVDHYDFTARAVELEFAHRVGKPIVLWTQSVGPFRSERARKVAQRIDRVAGSVWFRDQRSHDAWERMSPARADQERAVVADSVFGLAVPTHSAEEEPERDTTFISVRRWERTLDGAPSPLANYRDAVRELAMKRSDATVVALSTCQGVPSYGYDDSAVATAFFAGTEVVVDRDFHDPYALLDALKRAKAVVATRMHFSILAMLAGAPVAAIAYEYKSVDLFTAIGASDRCVAIDQVSGPWLVDRVGAALTDPQSSTVPPETLEELRRSAALPARSRGIVALLDA